MTQDMTEGNPLKLIVRFSIPLLLGNLFQQTYNMFDAAIVGRYLGSDSLAAVGATTSVQFLVLGFCIGICTGFSIPVAQNFGARDFKSMRNFIFLGAILSAFFAAVLSISCSILSPQILNMLKTPSDIFGNAHGYILVIFLGIPFTILYNYLAGILRAVGDAKTPFVFLIISAGTNIALDLLFIIAFGWGCTGAAAATVLSQALSGILCLITVLRRHEVLRLRREDAEWNVKKFGTLLGTGIPTGLQYSITAIGSMVMQSSNNSLGSMYISAFTAGSKLKQFAMCPFDALATGVSTFASQNYGAGKFGRIRKGLWTGVLIGSMYGLAAGLILIFFGRNLSSLFVREGDGGVTDAAGRYVFFLGFFYWILGFLNTMRMTTQGLGHSGLAIFSGITEMAARCAVSFGLVPKFGFDAICICDQTAWISATLYITPTCLLCIRKLAKDAGRKNSVKPDETPAD